MSTRPAATVVAVMVLSGSAAARNVNFGDVEHFSSGASWGDLFNGSDPSIGPYFSATWQSSGGWDNGGWLKISLVGLTPSGWEDGPVLLPLTFSPSAHVFAFWMQKVGTAYHSSLDAEEYKHAAFTPPSGSGTRPTLFNWPCTGYRFYAPGTLAGGGSVDEFGDNGGDSCSLHPGAHRYKEGGAGSTGASQWAFFVYEVDHIGSPSRNKLYIWTQDGTIDGTTPYAQSDLQSYTVAMGNFTFLYYLEGHSVAAAADAWIGVDYLGVSLTKPSPPPGFVSGGDVLPPVISNPQPAGPQAYVSNPQNVTLQVTTNENATCRMANTDTAYSSMTDTFASTGGTAHSEVKSLAAGTTYVFFVRCQDTAGNANSSSTSIGFSIAASGGTDGGLVDSGAGDAGLDAGAPDTGHDGGAADAAHDAGPTDGGADAGAPGWDGGVSPSDAGGVIGAASCGCNAGGALDWLAAGVVFLLGVPLPPGRTRRHRARGVGQKSASSRGTLRGNQRPFWGSPK